MKKCDSHKTFDVFVHYAVHGWIYQCTVFLIGTLLRIAAVAPKVGCVNAVIVVTLPLHAQTKYNSQKRSRLERKFEPEIQDTVK